MSRQVGIICTIGPATSSVSVLKKLMRSGMTVARLNFSHGSHAFHSRLIQRIRQASRETKKDIRILQDLEGFRIRVGHLPKGKPIHLHKRQKLVFCHELEIKNHPHAIPLDYEGSFKEIRIGSQVFIDDGNLVFKVTASQRGSLIVQVVVPGLLKERKGVHIPDLKLIFDGLTDKDEADIEFGIRHRVDWMAQSFVRSAEDVLHLKEKLHRRLPRVKIVSKIENQEGIQNFKGILKVSDGIMVARGDMGVCLPIWEVPMIQKKLIHASNRAGKFVITATQMLESMTENPRPTRAEASDVANAVLDGTDFVMLSGETAIGAYPVETVSVMQNIVEHTRTFI